jgi:Na+/glutamate symporter
MRVLFGLLGLVLGYPIVAFGGYWAVALLSDNTHDRGVEAAMTALFALGPLGAIIGLIVGVVLGGRMRRAGG